MPMTPMKNVLTFVDTVTSSRCDDSALIAGVMVAPVDVE